MSKKALNAAIALAKLSKCRHKHGAVLMKKGQVIATGTNIRLNGFPVNDSDWRLSNLHAEEMAISIAGTNASGATLYVARVNAHGVPRLSLPCDRCRGKIYRAKIRRVVST